MRLFQAVIGPLPMQQDEIDEARIDGAMLALTFLTLHDHEPLLGTERAGESFDWTR
jgi:hypothetical protein